MGNDTACKIVRIDSIWIKMFNRQVRTLKDLRHALDLRKNFLSLEILEAQGCKFSSTDGVLNVTKGSMTDFKVEHTTNLYKVIGNVVIGDASVASEKDTIKLWHTRFGHMSERDFQVLHSQIALPGIKHCKLNLCNFCIMGKQLRIAFTTSVYKIKGC